MAAPPAPAQAAPAVLPAAPHQTAPVILKKPTKVKDVKAIQVTDPKVATQMRAGAMALRLIPKCWERA